MPPRHTSQSGFTLIEVLIVVTLVVVLASMGMVQYTNSVQRTREAVLKEDLFRMREAIDQYYADKNAYPAGLAGFGLGRIHPRDSGRPDDALARHVADHAGRARPEPTSICRAGSTT